MLKLFHAPRSRSTRILWLLEEIGAPYEIDYVSIRRGDGSGEADPRNPHPDKKVPALVADGELVTESSAIVLYLTDAHAHARLGPTVGEPRRGEYLGWLSYSAGVIEPALFAIARGQAEGDFTAAAWGDPRNMERRLVETLSKGPYVLGEQFSGADILISSAVQFAVRLLPGHPEFERYLARCNERPAFQRAMAKDEA